MIKTIVLSQPAASIAVDSTGSLFYRRTGQNLIFKCPADAFGEIDPSTCAVVLNQSGATGVAVDRDSDGMGPDTDRLYVALGNRVAQYDAITLTKELEFGAGTLTETRGLIANSATDRIYVSDTGAGKDHVAVFGPPVPTPNVTTQAASNVKGATATLNGLVNPNGVEVTDCFFEYGLTAAYGKTAPCQEAIPTDSNDHGVTAAIGGLEPNGTTYHFRLVVDSATEGVKGGDRSFVTGNTVFTEPATDIAAATATLNGIVRPEGESFTDCIFEYGTALDYGHSVPCSPAAGSIPDDFDAHAVTGALTGLEPNTTYHFRLAATNADGTVRGEDRVFTTVGPPQIVEQRPIDVDRDSATLQARIDPSGSSTHYHFQFGTDTSYGIRIPADTDLNLAAGTEPVIVRGFRRGLQEKSVYWFRVVATNSEGTTVGPDQRLETLNEHDLPNNRAYELVTPVDKGSSALISGDVSGQQHFQAAPDGESFIYPLLNGLDSSTAGGWLRQRAGRTGEGWLSRQLSPPSLIPPPRSDGLGIAEPSHILYSSPDNGCGFLGTYNPITADTPQASVEVGVENLYRWSADGSYELVTDRTPPNADFIDSVYYSGVDAADDCSRVYFRTDYEFISGVSGLYEWDEGTLRDAGVLPNGKLGTPMGQAGRAVLGGQVDSFATGRWNAVSPDGSRVFFTAVANEGPSSGRPAVFMREDGGPSVEISASETGVATNGARFEAASGDAGRVFFRANYGIDAEAGDGEPTGEKCGPLGGSASETDDNAFEEVKIEKKPCDLYAYDVETGELSDLSADTNPADPIGAAIQGAIAVDDDGSHVYFAALGQLVPGKGRTYEQNTAGLGSANVYLAHEGELSYVTTLAEHGTVGGIWASGLFGVDRRDRGAALMRRAAGWVANTSADGGELLFMSSLNLTGYETGRADKYAAYVYSAETGKLTCVSCRPDGLPSLITDVAGIQPHQSTWLLAAPEPGGNYRPRSLSDDGSRVFFTSPDPLATGAVAGSRNVYQWQQGQVSLLAVGDPGGVNGVAGYLDATPSGRDVFIGSKEQLAPWDRDFVSDVYDVRVDGGFPFTPDPPECQVNESIPLQANQIYCQGDPSAQPGDPSPSSAGFAGPGNVKGKTNPCARRARRAQALSRRAKALRRGAKSASSRKAARRNANRARRAARAARRNSKAAKRCRRRARSANDNRGGSR